MRRILLRLMINIYSIARMKFKLRVSQPNTKVNLGCGFTVCGDWINLDANTHFLAARKPRMLQYLFYKRIRGKKPFSFEEYSNMLDSNRLHLHNLNYWIPFKNESIEYIYSSHFLEHLYLNEARKLINEMYRVLKPGGAVRIVVPDLDAIVSLLKKGKTTQALKGLYEDYKIAEFDTHKYSYNFDILKNELSRVGFKKIIKCSFKQGELPDINKLDNRQEESLFLEAKKI